MIFLKAGWHPAFKSVDAYNNVLVLKIAWWQVNPCIDVEQIGPNKEKTEVIGLTKISSQSYHKPYHKWRKKMHSF
jgi:hypothetical protein